jgi:threonine/homoserine/homoserine lactone efflux protein
MEHDATSLRAERACPATGDQARVQAPDVRKVKAVTDHLTGGRVGTAFLVTSLVIVATSGTGAIYTSAAGLQRGRRASLIAGLGCTAGIVPHLVAAVTGLAAVLYASAVAFSTIKYLGVVYLLFLAWQTWRDKTPLGVETATAPPTSVRVITQAVLINLLNPKLTIFFFVFLPQFVHTGEPHALQHMLMLSAVFMLLTLLVFAGYGTFAATMRARVLGRPRVVVWLRRVFAGTYLTLAGRLALPEH